MAEPLPQDRLTAEEKEILEQRAREFAKPEAAVVDRGTRANVVVLSLGKEQLGVPIERLKGVFEQFSVTPLLGTPSWLAGITHVRGELVSVVHLSHWLKQEVTSSPKVLAVVAGPYGPLGILVDGVVGFREIHEDELSDVLTQRAQKDQRPINAVTKDLVALLDLDAFLSSGSLIVDVGG